MSVPVHTVNGVVASDALGLVLPHEHLINDITDHGAAPDKTYPELAGLKVSADSAWILREHPYAVVDNCTLDSHEDALSELRSFAELGGTTVIDLTTGGLGRDRQILAQLSSESGVNVISGGGWYLEGFHPDVTTSNNVDELASLVVKDCIPHSGPRSGVIGEVGVSPKFTEREQRSLRAACRAQQLTGLPLFIHLPGFIRKGNDVLDLVLDQERVSPSSVVLCHLDPSSDDPDYQLRLAHRGVFLEFDMIGMNTRFAMPGEGDCPSTAQTATAISRLVARGFGKRILLSHDMFIKSMLRKNGGNGLSYVPGAFLGRLVEEGLPGDIVSSFNTTNVATLFEHAAQI